MLEVLVLEMLVLEVLEVLLMDLLVVVVVFFVLVELSQLLTTSLIALLNKLLESCKDKIFP